MDSASFKFVVYGLAVALISNLFASSRWRLAVLLTSSLVFLAMQANSVAALVPFAGFLLLGYLCLTAIARGSIRSRPICIVAIIGAFLWIKKYTVLPSAWFLEYPYLTVGVSYIFFRVLHLCIEAEPGGAAAIGPARYLAYTVNFTTLISGPIQRYDAFATDEFADPPLELDAGIVGRQLERIVRGFFKVNVLALLFDIVHTDALADLTQGSSLPTRLLAAFKLSVIYPFFLYNNFSGYIDIVIGIARLLRIRLPENFDRPFSAASFLDFWNRWHITLSLWLKTYVYNPLLVALARRTESLEVQQYLGVFCFFVTFFLVGVWHGRTSEFAVFGILQGGGVAANKLWQLWLTRALGRKGYKALAAGSLYTIAARGLTFSWFAFTLYWFWSDWTQIDAIAASLRPEAWLSVWIAVIFAASVTLAAWERLRTLLLAPERGSGYFFESRFVRVGFAASLALLAFIMVALLDQPAPDIVYKAF
jgi:D-alanyl-lipoteichoic acid acyltransferase DltB (MBOAT superfamily)